MAGKFSGKVALVTGAGSGIGRASAQAFANAGARVLVADVVVDGGEETVRLIMGAGGEAAFVQADVSQSSEVETLVQHTLALYGRLDCAFNNAGIEGSGTGTIDHLEDAWDRVIEVNLKGVWLCMKYEIPAILKQGGGAIVNNASVAGLKSGAGTLAYTASKHGVVGLTKAVALEFATQGIRVNAVCPGIIRTPMVERIIAANPAEDVEAQLIAFEPVGRLGLPEEVARAVVWLCSNAASFVIGAALPVDGGRAMQ